MSNAIASAKTVSSEPASCPRSMRLTIGRSIPATDDSFVIVHPRFSRARRMSSPCAIACAPETCASHTVPCVAETRHVVEMLPLNDQLRMARERAGLKKTHLGHAVGWADHTNVIRVENGGDTEASAIVRWAEACGHELLIVPKGTTDSVLARARDANERELRIAEKLLDLLIEFRDDPRAADYLERDIAALRERFTELRSLLPSVG